MAARKPFRIMVRQSIPISSQAYNKLWQTGQRKVPLLMGGSQVVNEGGLAENSVLNDGGTLDVREKRQRNGDTAE